MQFDNLHIKPQPRGGHATVTVGEKLICFGGADRTPSPAGDIWTLQPGAINAKFSNFFMNKALHGQRVGAHLIFHSGLKSKDILDSFCDPIAKPSDFLFRDAVKP